jgi:hypothetical protein
MCHIFDAPFMIFLSRIVGNSRRVIPIMSKFLLKTLVFALASTSLAVPCLSAAQATAPAPATGDTAPPYVRADLNMTYTPPAGWKAQDISLVKAEGGDDKAATCMKVLYSATPESAAQGAGGLSIGVTLIDAARSCVAKDITPEFQLQSMVENSGKMPGMKIFKNPTAYFIDANTFWAMVAKGKPQLANGTAAPEDIYMAIVGGVVKDHVLLWEMTAPDQAVLQQMLNSTVQVGKKPHILYKVNLK